MGGSRTLKGTGRACVSQRVGWWGRLAAAWGVASWRNVLLFKMGERIFSYDGGSSGGAGSVGLPL